MTILQIAALKKVKKGSRILLLDKNGSVAKDIAKGLNARGYKKVYVVDGGFNGWTSSKLQTRGSSSVRLKALSLLQNEHADFLIWRFQIQPQTCHGTGLLCPRLQRQQIQALPFPPGVVC